MRSTVPVNAEEEAQSLFVTEVGFHFLCFMCFVKTFPSTSHLPTNLVILMNVVKELMTV